MMFNCWYESLNHWLILVNNNHWYKLLNHYWLVVWKMNFIFPYIGNVIIPTDELIFFRGVGIPLTS